ncbi:MULTISPECIES: hydrogen peroxide-inducible genes activator [unclassified Aureispira]|uniref:hydrogen peroxide-inducible genes activator n=1 Tax=unclassified Aureispira TaxID=2649989 RepID=UPI000697B841|nr:MULTISPECIES: hydrogen peroxide-inducible genes activator [unclassified Aureispira]WMX16433.1 LysR substrate-binding domain-containing protein [Aureispira sp. CCB-E]
MNIQQIKYAIAVAEVQSFGKAAEKCFITQSTLSTMVSKLESELGLQLFDRKTKPITTTKEGAAILKQLKIIHKELDILDEVVGDLKGESSGQLNIGVIPTVAPYLLPLFLNNFVQQHPNIKFVISEMTTDHIIKGLESRNLDIGILSTPLKHDTLIEKPLYNEPFLLFDKTRRSSKKNIKVSEIDCNRLWLLNEGHCLRTQVETICNLHTQRDDNWNLEYKSGTIDTLMKFVRKNQAITLLPYLATLDLPEEDLEYLHPISAPQPAREISLVVHQHFVKKRILDSIQTSIQNVTHPILEQQQRKKWLVAPI